MATIIMNTGRVPLQVGLIKISTGAKITTRVMGRGRGTIAADYKIDPTWMALYGKQIKLIENSTLGPQVKAASAKTNSSKPKPKVGKAAQTVQATVVAKSPTVTPTAAPTVTPVVASKTNPAPTVQANKGA